MNVHGNEIEVSAAERVRWCAQDRARARAPAGWTPRWIRAALVIGLSGGPFAACEPADRGSELGAGARSGPIDYVMVDALLADPRRARDKVVMVHGWVQPGSAARRVVDGQTITSFVLHESRAGIRVFYRGPVPDTFRDQSEVVVTGRVIDAATRADLASRLGVELGSDHVVDATELSAKCPSKYDEAPRPTAPRFQ